MEKEREREKEVAMFLVVEEARIMLKINLIRGRGYYRGGRKRLSLTFPALALTFLFLSCSCTQFHLILIPSSCLVHVLIHIPMWGKLRSLVRVSNIVSFLNKNKNSSALTFLANSWVHNYINN